MGNLIRIAVILIAVWLVIRFVRQALARRRVAREQESTATIEEMVPCAHCGIHVPRSRALGVGGDYYCSKPHQEAGPHR